jgi:hypothetical protein
VVAVVATIGNRNGDGAVVSDVAHGFGASTDAGGARPPSSRVADQVRYRMYYVGVWGETVAGGTFVCMVLLKPISTNCSARHANER